MYNCFLSVLFEMFLIKNNGEAIHVGDITWEYAFEYQIRLVANWKPIFYHKEYKKGIHNYL